MNSRFSFRNFTFTAIKFSILLLIVLMVQNMRADDSMKSRVDSLSNEYQAFVNNKTIQTKMIDKINAEIVELQNRANKIDALKAEIDKLQMEVPDLEAEYKNADARATGLENQLEGKKQNATNRVNALLQQQNGICSQLGGSIQNNECIFSCPQNNMGPCQAKVNSFDNQVATIKSQIQSTASALQSDLQEAENARSNASAKNAEWDSKNTEMEQKKTEYDTKREQFFADATRVGNELDGAHIKPTLKGPAWQQLNNVNADQHNYDNFTGNVVITTNTASIPVPEVADKSPEYKKAYESATKAVDTATQRAEAAEKALHAAEANHATQEELQQLIKKSSDATSAKIWLIYQRSLLNGGTPKQSN
jgi:hypothetical protein